MTSAAEWTTKRGGHSPETDTRHVLVVDDHASTLAASATPLELEQPNISVVGTARNGVDALPLAHDAALDALVLLLDLDGENGLELIPTLVCTHGISVITLTSANVLQKKRLGFAAGAKAFVSKYAPSGELIAAILAVQLKHGHSGGLSLSARTLIPDK